MGQFDCKLTYYQNLRIRVAVLRSTLLNRCARKIRMSHVTIAPTSKVSTRPALLSDLPRLAEIYNYYILNTHITFNITPFTPETFRPWFDEHSDGKRHRLVVAIEAGNGRIIGYAGTARFRPKEAYETTVETTIYCSHDCTQLGIGTMLYHSLFEAIAGEDINRIVAGVTLPNPASVALHERFGFRHLGTFTRNGRKFGKYWDVAWFERPLKLE